MLYMINYCMIFCIVLGFVGYFTEKKVFNPVSVILFMWGIIVYLSSLQLYTLYEASEEIYMYIFIGLVAFTIGYYIVRFILKNGRIRFIFGKSNNANNIIPTLNYKIVYILFSICLIYIFYRISRYGAIIVSSGFNLSAIGSIISEVDLSEPGIINAISFLVVAPLYLPLTIVFSVDFWSGKRDKKLLIFTIIMTLGRIIIYGGRQPIIQLFVAMIISFTFSFRKYRDDMKKSVSRIKNKTGLVITIIAAIISFGYLTGTKTNAPLKTIYLDFAMQPYMFEYWSNSIDNEYAYGFASLFGFIHPILYVFKNLFGIFSEIPYFFSNIFDTIQETFSTWISIGTKLIANAYTSSFWYLYYDGRELGIFIGMFIWGIASFIYFIKAKKDGTLLNVANYTMILIGLIYTFTDMEFYKASYVLGFFYLNMILYKKKKLKIRI